MKGSTIKNNICNELSRDEQAVALSFVDYLESRSLSSHRDTGVCWKDKIYYWVTLKDKCVCFIAIKDPDEKETGWTVWSDNMGSGFLEDYPAGDELKRVAWSHIDHCGHCGSCPGGRRKTIFGKEFSDICGCTFRVDDPCADDLDFLKTMVDIRIQEILAN